MLLKHGSMWRSQAVGVVLGALAFVSGSAVAQDEIYIDVGRGEFPVYIPYSYDPDTPAALIMLLHGYSETGQRQENLWRLKPLMEEFGFVYVYPDGTQDSYGNRFWNATDACCDFERTGVDDSAYLRNVLGAIEGLLNIDERRVYVVGFSNGGFMSHRMACDHADKIAAIASLAGATHLDPEACLPVEPVHILQIHGTEDEAVRYGGGNLCEFPDECWYPGAIETVEQWATQNGCTLAQTEGPPLDLDRNLPGDETTVAKYVTDCDLGGSAELWSIVGGSHYPALSSDFNRHLIEYLFAHPKPAPCPPDLDASDDVGFSDLLVLLAAWGPCQGECPEDLDGSDDVGFSDLLALLTVWGPCSPVGACCFTDGTCVQLSWEACVRDGGSYQGDGTTCEDSCPPTDDCEAAALVGDGSYEFSTIGSSDDGPRLPPECDEGNGTTFRRDVWIRYLASCTGVATASVCDSDYDTKLAVYAVDPIECPGSTVIACSDDACGEDGTRSEAMFPAVEGEEYLVRIGGRTSTGTGTLVLSCEEGFR